MSGIFTLFLCVATVSAAVSPQEWFKDHAVPLTSINLDVTDSFADMRALVFKLQTLLKFLLIFTQYTSSRRSLVRSLVKFCFWPLAREPLMSGSSFFWPTNACNIVILLGLRENI